MTRKQTNKHRWKKGFGHPRVLLLTQNIHISITQRDLLGAIKARVAQALSCDNMADPVKTVAAIVLAVFAICAVGAAHFTPITHKRNAFITAIFRA